MAEADGELDGKFVGESSGRTSRNENFNDKLVYLFTLDLPPGSRGKPTFNWCCIDPHGVDDRNPLIFTENDNTKNLSIPTTNTPYYPHELLNLEHYSITIWNSRIYFVGGGEKSNFLVHSDKVFVFDTRTTRWIDSSDPHPPPSPMMQPRLHPVVIAYRNRIYAFGSAGFDIQTHKPTHLPGNQWAECYDLRRPGGDWKYLPVPPPPLLVSTDLIDSHVVYKSKKMFLFSVHNGGVYSYSVPDKTWHHYAVTDPISNLPGWWSSRVEILGDILFWHFHGTIYAYDFVLKKTISLYNFKDKLQIGPECPYESTYLVRVAQGKLCLVWVVRDLLKERNETIRNRMMQMRARTVHCHKFQVLLSKATRKLSLNHEASTSFTTPSYAVQTVLPV